MKIMLKENDINKPIEVSVCVMTFNHQPFIKECLDGILNQKVGFGVEIIVNDDCSTDETTEIIKEYERLYPNIIRPVYHKENLYWTYKEEHKDYYNHIMFPMARGRYIACCDGDDYWTDPLKLQKQYELMEKNPQYSLCHHNYDILCGGRMIQRTTEIPQIMDLAGAASKGYIQTTSMFFRNPHECLIPENFPFRNTLYQFFWAVRLAEFGDIYYIDEVMDVARQHEGGIFNGSDTRNKFMMSAGNIDNMILWYAHKGRKDIVKVLQKRLRKEAKGFFLSCVKHLDVSGVALCIKNLYMSHFVIKVQ